MPHIGYFGYADFAVPLQRESDKQDEATASHSITCYRERHKIKNNINTN